MIAVIGDGAGVPDVVDAIRSAGGSVSTLAADTATRRDPDLVVTVGEAALLDVVDAGVDTHVLAVDPAGGVPGPTISTAIEASESLVTGEFAVERHPLIDVSVDGDERGVAIYDVTLRTTEPARISEFSVETDRPIDRFRADGVVVATPLGSTGYARAVGGPIVDGDRPGLVVAPIAAFAIGPKRYVVGADDALALAVEREDAEVSIDIDGRPTGTVPAGVPVGLTSTATLRTVVLGGDRTETL